MAITKPPYRAAYKAQLEPHLSAHFGLYVAPSNECFENSALMKVAESKTLHLGNPISRIKLVVYELTNHDAAICRPPRSCLHSMAIPKENQMNQGQVRNDQLNVLTISLVGRLSCIAHALAIAHTSSRFLSLNRNFGLGKAANEGCPSCSLS